MHGLIFASLRDYTIHRLGDERTGEIWGDRLFETTEAYADEWFLAQLERLAVAAGETALETERGFGVFAAQKTFAGLFPGYYAESGDTCAFLLGRRGEDPRARARDVPGATPPRLHVQPLGELGVLVSYTSERRLCRLLDGLVHGTAAHYGERIELDELQCMHRGDAGCVFSVTLVEVMPGHALRRRSASPGGYSRRRLRPGEAAAPERESLALLPSGSDAVRTLPVRGTRPSTPRARDLSR